MKRIVVTLALAASLSGCGIFRGSDKPKTPVLGERVAVLTAESGAEIDPAIADLAVTLPPSQVNTSWTQPGGNATKSMGNPSLAPSLARAERRAATIAMARTPIARDVTEPPRAPGSPWPWFAALMAALALLWWLERARPPRRGAEPA